MITGDHKITATAIAKSLGIITTGDCVLTGTDVEMMSDEQFKEMAGNVAVFARVAPEHKAWNGGYGSEDSYCFLSSVCHCWQKRHKPCLSE